MPVFETSLVLEVTPEQAFDFLTRPANHELLSPPGLGLKFVNAPEVFEVGSEFDFKIQAWGVVQTIHHRVTQFHRPTIFVEEQTKGPLKLWIHEHRFEAKSPHETAIIDVIRFEPPGGIMGMMVTANKIVDNLEDGFFHRHQQMKKLLKGQA